MLNHTLIVTILSFVSFTASATTAVENQIKKCPRGQTLTASSVENGCSDSDGKTGKWFLFNAEAKEWDIGLFYKNVKTGEWAEWERDPERDTYTDTQFYDDFRLAKGVYKNGLREGDWETVDAVIGNRTYQQGIYKNGSRCGSWFSRGGRIQFNENPAPLGESNRIYKSIFDMPMVKKPLLVLITISGMFLMMYQFVISFMGSFIMLMLSPVRAIVQYLIKE